jgi:hypothetical protein
MPDRQSVAQQIAVLKDGSMVVGCDVQHPDLLEFPIAPRLS